MNIRLDGRVALITGAGGSGAGWGVGKAIAACLADAGARIGVLDVNASAAQSTLGELERRGGSGAVLLADVRHPDQLQESVVRCHEVFGRLDILVNNVALGAVGSVIETPVEDWDRVMSVNLRAAYLACKYSMPQLLASGAGRVVNVASIAATRYTGTPIAAYAASKAGLLALSREVACTYADRNVRSNAVLVGLIDTPMIRAQVAAFKGSDDIEEVMRTRDARVPTGRQGTAWDVAHLVTFLCSDFAQFINGAEIVIDGGTTARIG